MSSNEIPGALSAWQTIKRIADRLESPHADKIFVGKDYTKADLRRDLLATIPDSVKSHTNYTETALRRFLEATE